MHVVASHCLKWADLASLKSDTHKLDIDKEDTTPDLTDLSKLSDVLKDEVVKKTVYDKLIKRINVFQTNDTSNLVKRADYDETKKKVLAHNHDKYVTTQQFNELRRDDFAAKLKQAKDDTADFIKKTNFDEKLKKITKKILQINKKCRSQKEIK